MRNHDLEFKEWCERVLSASMKRGDKRAISNGSGVSLGFVSQQCNPAEPQPSYFYLFMDFLRHWTSVNPEGARAIAACVAASVETWAGTDEAEDRAKLAAAFAIESAEFTGTQIQRERIPEPDQIKELMDVFCTGYRWLAAQQRKGARAAQPRTRVSAQRRAG